MTLKGLAALKKLRDERSQNQDRPKAVWYRPPKDGSTIVIKFLQELDTDGEGYKSERGIAITQVEHQAPGPEGYKSRANCTLESEGRCWACEQNVTAEGSGQWPQKTNFYINVLDGSDDTVKILSRNVFSDFVGQLMEFYEENDSIVLVSFKTNKPSGKKSSWSLVESKKENLDDSNRELWDLAEAALRRVPYEKQEEYYMRNASLATNDSDDSKDEW